MKTKRLIALVALIATASLAELVPELLTVSWYRTNAVSTVAASTYYKGSTLRLTNCTAYAASGAIQNLTGLGILVRVGDSATNLLAIGAAQIATNGTFSCTAAIPATGGSAMRVQVKLTNSAAIYIYPALSINVEAAL